MVSLLSLICNNYETCFDAVEIHYLTDGIIESFKTPAHEV